MDQVDEKFGRSFGKEGSERKSHRTEWRTYCLPSSVHLDHVSQIKRQKSPRLPSVFVGSMESSLSVIFVQCVAV